MQAAFQKYTDNAVSKTVNLRTEATHEDIAKVFMLAYELGCKGVTIYRNGSRNEQILTKEGYEEIKHLDKRFTQNPTGVVPAKSYSAKTPTGRMYLFVREKINSQPFDIFVVLGRSGSDITPLTEAIGRLLSICLRSKIPIEKLAENLIDLGGRTTTGFGPDRIKSVPDAIGKFLKSEYCSTLDTAHKGDLCPDCKNKSRIYRRMFKVPPLWLYRMLSILLRKT